MEGAVPGRGCDRRETRCDCPIMRLPDASQLTLKLPERAFPNALAYRPAIGIYFLAWLLLSSPWLSGAVTIPYDAKALFQAQLQFLANALHSGQSPFWNPST